MPCNYHYASLVLCLNLILLYHNPIYSSLVRANFLLFKTQSLLNWKCKFLDQKRLSFEKKKSNKETKRRNNRWCMLIRAKDTNLNDKDDSQNHFCHYSQWFKTLKRNSNITIHHILKRAILNLKTLVNAIFNCTLDEFFLVRLLNINLS